MVRTLSYFLHTTFGAIMETERGNVQTMVGQAHEIPTAKKQIQDIKGLLLLWDKTQNSMDMTDLFCFGVTVAVTASQLVLALPVQTTTHTDMHIWHFGPGSLKYKHPVQFCSIKEMLCKAGPCLSNLWLSTFLL